MDLIINTDGASRGNPGPASYGYIIRSSDGLIQHQEGKAIGINTNNVAEYTAVLRAFEYVNEQLKRKAPHKIRVVADSMLVTQQLAGKFKIKNPNLKIIFDKIKTLEFELGDVIYQHTPRENNFIADRLANEALDRQR